MIKILPFLMIFFESKKYKKGSVLNHGGFHLHLDDIRALIGVLMVVVVVAARSASRIKGKPDSNLARLPGTVGM